MIDEEILIKKLKLFFEIRGQFKKLKRLGDEINKVKFDSDLKYMALIIDKDPYIIIVDLFKGREKYLDHIKEIEGIFDLNIEEILLSKTSIMNSLNKELSRLEGIMIQALGYVEKLVSEKII